MDADTRFSKAHGYIEFPLKQMAIDFLRTLAQTTGAQLFARDKDNPNNPGAQVFIIAIAKAIYKRSVYALIAGTPASYYEWMGDGMKVLDETVKNTIDMDMEGVARTRPFNEDIVWVVQFVSAAIEARYKVVVPKSQWVVLKCDYDVVKQKFIFFLAYSQKRKCSKKAAAFFLQRPPHPPRFQVANRGCQEDVHEQHRAR